MGVRGACFLFGPVQVDTRHLQTTPSRQPRSPALYIAHDPRNSRTSQVCKRAELFSGYNISSPLCSSFLAPYDNFRALGCQVFSAKPTPCSSKLAPNVAQLLFRGIPW